MLTTELSTQPYSGTGSTSLFPITFPVLDRAHLVVTKTASGVSTTLVDGVDYYATGLDSPSYGSVQLTKNDGSTPKVLASGETLVISRVTPYTQTLNLRNQGTLSAEALEEALDYQMMTLLRLRDYVNTLALGGAVEGSFSARLYGAISGYTDLKTDSVAGAGTYNFPAVAGTSNVASREWVIAQGYGTGGGGGNYLAPWVGSVSRTQDSKNQDPISVMDFGADNTGATNCATAVQAALTNCGGGKGVHFPHGTYLIGTAGWAGLSITGKNNFSITADPGTIIKVASAPSQTTTNAPATVRPAIALINCTKFTISGIVFDANSTTSTHLTLDGCSHGAVMGCEFTGNKAASTVQYSICAPLSNRMRFNNNHFNAVSSGVYTSGSSVSIVGNTVYDWGNTLTSYFVNASAATGLNVSGNTVDCASASLNTFVKADSCYQFVSSGNVAKVSRYGYNLTSMDRFSIVGNHLECNTLTEAAYVAGTHGSITGNSFRECNKGVYSTKLTNTTISANTITGDGIIGSGAVEAGVKIVGNASDGIRSVSIIGNTIRGFSSTGCAGIWVQVGAGTASNIVISGNNCATNNYGLSIFGPVGSEFSGVVVTGNYLNTIDCNLPRTSLQTSGNYGVWSSTGPYDLINDRNVTTFRTAAPTTGYWYAGDRCVNSSPTVGQPKAWVNTADGIPGTWVSEGNL